MADLSGDSAAKSAGDATAQPGDTGTATLTHAKKVTFDEGSEPGVDHEEKSGDWITASDNDGAASRGNNDDSVSVDAATAAIENIQLEDGSQEKKKKKKKRKRTPASRKNITGFEEFYADAPLTPAEAASEKKDLYNPTRLFSDRIEECIQRYRARRRLDEERTNMFNKYLFLGGIDSSPRQFTGMARDVDALTEADAAEVRRMTAIDFVGGAGGRFYDDAYADDWEVDFEAIAKGFLSRTIPDWYMYDEEAIEKAAGLVKNFLNYVLMHDVCPEYRQNVLAARDICDVAPAELRCMHELIAELPGPFNGAARLLFCDGMANDLDDPKNLEAWYRFRVTVLVWAADNQEAKDALLKIEDPASIRVRSTKEQTYRVIEIERPRRKDVVMFKAQLARAGHGEGGGGGGNGAAVAAAPVGLIRVIPDVIAHGWGNLPRPDEVDFSDAPEEQFLVEDELLAKFRDGMKVRMTVCELELGGGGPATLRFIKHVSDLRVSFDTFLPQYLMTQWKDPVPNDRAARSVHDPDGDAEEGAADEV